MKDITVLLSIIMLFMVGVLSAGTVSAMTAKQTVLNKSVITGKPVRLEINLTPSKDVELLLVMLSVYSDSYGNTSFLIPGNKSSIIIDGKIISSCIISLKAGESWIGNVTYIPPFAGKFFYQFDVQCNDTSENITTSRAILTVRDEPQSENLILITGFTAVVVGIVTALIVAWVVVLAGPLRHAAKKRDRTKKVDLAEDARF